MRIPSPRAPRAAAAALAAAVAILLAVAAVSAKSRAQTLEIAPDGTVLLSPGTTLLDADARPADAAERRADGFGLPGDRFLVGRTGFGPPAWTSASPSGSLRLRGRTFSGLGIDPALRPEFDEDDPVGEPGAVFRRPFDDALVLRDRAGRPVGVLEARGGDLVARGGGGLRILEGGRRGARLSVRSGPLD
jgi:hypothetical protein